MLLAMRQVAEALNDFDQVSDNETADCLIFFYKSEISS